MRLAEQPDMSDAVVVDWLYPEASRDTTGALTVDALDPDTTYYVDIDVDGAPALDAPLSFTTPPPLGAPGYTKIAFGSCAKDEEQPIFAAIDALDPDLFFYVGDNHYANSADLGSLRRYYRWSLERPERGAFAATTSTLATWDDHDYVGNNTDGDDAGKDVALRVFQEYWANPGAGTAETPGVFFSHSWGDVDFFFVDDRYYRGYDDSILGDAQTAWLLDALDASDAAFKLVVCGSQWTMEGSDDSWREYPEARDAIFDDLRDLGIEGVVLLSGDVHRSELRRIDRDDAGAYDLPELTSSPLANDNASCDEDDDLRACLDQTRYFTTLEIDTTAAEPYLLARVRDEAGEVVSDWLIYRYELSL
jgi:alkaline phosphatase D